jgi:hypothetical protein
MISRRNLSGSSRLIPCPGAGPTAALTPAPNGRPARRTRQRHRRRGREKHPFDRSDPRWSVSTDPKAANLGESIFTDEIRPFWLASSSAPYLARRSWPATRSTPQAPPPGFQLVQCDDEMMRVPPAPEGFPPTRAVLRRLPRRRPGTAVPACDRFIDLIAPTLSGPADEDPARAVSGFCYGRPGDRSRSGSVPRRNTSTEYSSCLRS